MPDKPKRHYVEKAQSPWLKTKVATMLACPAGRTQTIAMLQHDATMSSGAAVDLLRIGTEPASPSKGAKGKPTEQSH